MKLLLLSFVIGVVSPVHSEEILPFGARSANGRRELSQAWPSGLMILRERRSRSIVDRFLFLSYSGGKFPADHVYWSPNARCFALEVEDMRGPMLRVYRIADSGVVEIPTPSLHEMQLSGHPRKAGVEHGEFPDGGTSFVRWLDDRSLILRYTASVSIEWDYSITFRIASTRRLERIATEDHLAQNP